MTGDPHSDEIPTWYSDIRFMFNEVDINHMKNHDPKVDLTNYDIVKGLAYNIYGRVKFGNMPKVGKSWSDSKVRKFGEWIDKGCPKGRPTPKGAAELSPKAQGDMPSGLSLRLRKDISTFEDGSDDLEKLKKAFQGIMDKEPSDPNSYFVQAGYHWFPVPYKCLHHVPPYNPWHRAYLLSFENALRSVPGCEDVTLPYWDITTPFPDVLTSPPFDRYTLPQKIGEGYPEGYTTERNFYDLIQKILEEKDVSGKIERALRQAEWEDFHGLLAGARHNTIIAAHDSGHNAIGPTMEHQEVASFDPVFWFFHANWDRLFWLWQTKVGATTVSGLLSTIESYESRAFFDGKDPRLKILDPFTSSLGLDTISVIDLVNSLGVDYEPPSRPSPMDFLPKTQLAVAASQNFSVNSTLVNVRVKNLNRLAIPGSFEVDLLRDGNKIASTSFFQPKEAEKCETCVNNAIVHFDFELPLQAISDGELSVVVRPLDTSFIGDSFPHKMMGNPTIDVRLLIGTK